MINILDHNASSSEIKNLQYAILTLTAIVLVVQGLSAYHNYVYYHTQNKLNKEKNSPEINSEKQIKY